MKAYDSNENELMKQKAENLHILVIRKILSQTTDTFPKFLARYKEEIATGLARLNADYLQNLSEIGNKLLIVSHEYLYGYDLWEYSGLTREEKNEFKEALKGLVSEITQKYNIDVMIAPGTVIWKKSANDQGEAETRNTAYFFSRNGVGKHHKYKAGRFKKGDVIKWQCENSENILTTICSENRYFSPTEAHTIQFIPSAGCNIKASSCGSLSRTPGTTFINIDGAAYIRQVTVEAVQSVKGPFNVQNADRFLREPSVVDINPHTSLHTFLFDQKFHDEVVMYQTGVVIREIELLDIATEEKVLFSRVLKGECALDSLQPYLNTLLDEENPVTRLLAVHGRHLPLKTWLEKHKATPADPRTFTKM